VGPHSLADMSALMIAQMSASAIYQQLSLRRITPELPTIRQEWA
jgi:hypothetical protein